MGVNGEQMRLLVTGCAGFIGINFLKYYITKHPCDYIIGCDKLTYAANLSEIDRMDMSKKIHLYRCDITDRDQMAAIMLLEKPDAVINFAAESHVDNSIHSPTVFIKTNIEGTEVLLSSCIKSGVKRFHQVSTDEIYGSLQISENSKFHEKNTISPRNPYAATKASSDMIALSYFHTYGLHVSISRCSNNYGPWQHCEKFIPKIICSAIEGKPIPVYGTGQNMREWIHVLDHCNALDIILGSAPAGEIYNIGSGICLSNNEIATIILEKMNKSKELLCYVQDRPGHDMKYFVSTEKIRSLGWSPKIDLEEGLEETISWYVRNYKK